MAESLVTETAGQAGKPAEIIVKDAAQVAATSTEAKGVQTAATIDVQAEIKKAQEEADRKWQAKFDKVLAEKKTEESKALTLEQRFELSEKARRDERIEWARKEARAKATISDDLESAIKLYGAETPEDIAKGASEIRKLIDSETAPLKLKIEEYEKQIKFGSGAPKGSGEAPGAITRAAFEALSPDAKRAYLKPGMIKD